jgi:hypothetical protein
MAISAIMAAVSTATAYAGGTLFFSSIAAHFLITTAMGAALNALTPKPSFGAASGGYSLQGVSGAALDHQVIYGETRVGGVRVYDAATGDNNQTLNRIVAFAGHEVDSYQEIYLNDEVITLSGASVTAPERYNGQVALAQYFGTTTQTADAGLITETAELEANEGKWTSDHRLQGIAYLYTKFVYDADAFPNGVPAVSAVIRGKKIYDPRDTNQDVDDETTWVWSDNPALCLRDYLTSEYGLNQPADRIDDSLVIAAANICDQTTEGEKRYTCNGAFTTNAEPSSVATNILSSMGGLLWYGQGKWRMKAAAWTAPTVSFTEDDLRSSISLSTRHSRRDNFNSVKGTFRGSDSDWQPADYKEVTDPAFLEADNGLVNVLDFSLPFTSSSLTAQRVARIALNRNREQLTFSASFGMRAFQVQVGDFINITNERFGFVNKPFEVTEWTFGLTEGLDVQVRMTLREISEGVFTGVNGAAFEQNNTTLPNPFTGLEINNLVVSGGGRTQGDGTFINSALLSWDSASNAFTSYYEIEWKPVADSSYASTTTTETSIELSPLVDGIEYAFRVRAVSALGTKGPITSALFTGGGDVTAPNVPTSFSATGTLGFIDLSWVSPSDVDLNYTEVWESPNSNFASAVQIARAFGNTFNRGNLAPLTTRYYWLRSVDFSDNKSAFVGPVNATTRQIEVGDIGPAVIQYDDFASDVTDLFDGIIADVSDRVLISDYNITVDYQQQLEDATTQLATDALTLALNASSLESRVNDAGITVDPATGSVTIQGLSAVEDRVNTVEIDLDAVEGELILKASTTYVNNAIAAATLPEATLAALEDLEARVDTVEIDLNAVEGSITLTSTGSIYNVNDGVLGVEALEGRITVNEGEITLKASQTELDDVETRLGSAEIQLNSLDAPSITLAVQDVRTISNKQDDLGELTLQEVLGRYNDREYVLRDVAFARQSLTADVNEQGEAIATLTTELQAQINDNVATILSEQQARADADSALAFDITELEVSLSDTDGNVAASATAISGLDTRVTTAEGNISSQASQITSLSTTVGGNTTSITQAAESIDGIEGKFGVTIDNNGAATGFQLLSGVGGSAFNVRADQFAVFNSTGAGGDNPFTVFTSSRTLNGVVFPAGTYIKDAIIDRAAIVDGTITTAAITDGSITSAKIGTAEIQTANIQNGAVTNRFAAFTAGAIGLTGSFQLVQSVSIDADGAPVSVTFNTGVSGTTRTLIDVRVDGASQRVFVVSSGYYPDDIRGSASGQISINGNGFISSAPSSFSVSSSGFVTLNASVSPTKTFFYEQMETISMIVTPSAGSRNIEVFARTDGGASSSPLLRNRFLETTELKR